MEAFRTILVQGLTFGSIYAVAALGFGLIYNTTKAFHIAYGAIAVVGSYVIVAVAPAGPLPKLLVATVLGILASFVLTVAVFGLYRVVRGREGERLAVFVISLGVGLAIESTIILVRDADPRHFNLPGYLKLHDVLGFWVSGLGVAVVAVGLLAIGGLEALLKYTKWGYQLQGLAANPELATLVGIRRSRVIPTMLLAASGLGTIAALMLGMYTTVTPSGGTNLALVASVAVIAGGVGSYLGAYLFALMTGFLQATMAYALPGSWTTVGVYGAILLVILVRPSGLGRGWVTRAA